MKKAWAFLLALCLTAALCAGASAAGMGDVEGGDGAVTAADARRVLRAAVGLEQLTEEEEARADMDLDGGITAADARLTLRAAVGLEITDGKTYLNQVEVLCGGHYFARISIEDANGRTDYVMASTENYAYFSSELDGIHMTMVSAEEGLYLLDDEKKTYALLPVELMALLGDETEGLDLHAAAQEGFSKLKELENAELSEAEFDGEPCLCYTLREPSGVTKAYMSGKRLLALTSESRTGTLLVTERFEEISPSVPLAYAGLPADYAEIDLLEYLAGLEGQLE